MKIKRKIFVALLLCAALLFPTNLSTVTAAKTNNEMYFDSSVVYLAKGEIHKPYLHYSFNETITWSSKDSKIATVDKNGIIKAKKVGKTTITAQVKGKKYNLTLYVVIDTPHD